MSIMLVTNENAVSELLMWVRVVAGCLIAILLLLVTIEWQLFKHFDHSGPKQLPQEDPRRDTTVRRPKYVRVITKQTGTDG